MRMKLKRTHKEMLAAENKERIGEGAHARRRNRAEFMLKPSRRDSQKTCDCVKPWFDAPAQPDSVQLSRRTRIPSKRSAENDLGNVD